MAGPKPKLRHTRRFMQGRMTPEELHAQLGVAAPCKGCGAPGLYTARIYILISDLKPDMLAVMRMMHGSGSLPTVALKPGPAVCVSHVVSCKRCWPSMQKALLKAPSYAWCDIDMGPGPERTLVQVPAIGAKLA